MSSRVFVDSDILIWQLRGHPSAEPLLIERTTQATALWISAVQRIEILFHVRRGEDQRARTLLARLETEPLTNGIIDRAAALYRYWSPRSGTGRFDAILAATVLESDGTLLTNNVRHFPMPELRVEQGWDTATASRSPGSRWQDPSQLGDTGTDRSSNQSRIDPKRS